MTSIAGIALTFREIFLLFFALKIIVRPFLSGSSFFTKAANWAKASLAGVAFTLKSEIFMLNCGAGPADTDCIKQTKSIVDINA